MDSTRIEQVFERLLAIYGAKFGDQFEEEQAQIVKAEWSSVLEQFQDEIVAQALGRCHIQYKTWPPTLGEFVALCKAQRPPNYLKLAAPREPAPAGIFDKLREQVRRPA